MHEARQVFGTRCLRPGPMLLLLDPHSFHDGATPGVGPRQAVEMSFQVFRYLPFRFLDETQRPTITEGAAGNAKSKRSRIPERPEPARRCAEFFEPLFAPTQVIEFFRGRFMHVICYRMTSRDRCMSLVEPLGRYFARVIDPHEPRRVHTFIRRQLCIRYPIGGIGSARAGFRSCNAAQNTVDAGEQAVSR
jgi:hypothetical protein